MQKPFVVVIIATLTLLTNNRRLAAEEGLPQVLWSKSMPSPFVTQMALIDSNSQLYLLGAQPNPNASIFIRTLKFDAWGNVQWDQTFNRGPGAITLSQAKAMVLDEQNNLYIVGRSRLRPEDHWDLITLKYTSRGQLEWVDYVSTSSASGMASAITLGADGDHLLVLGQGETGGSAPSSLLVRYRRDGRREAVKWLPHAQLGAASALTHVTEGFTYLLAGGTLQKLNSALSPEWGIAGDAYDFVVDRQQRIVTTAPTGSRCYSPEGKNLWTQPRGGTQIKTNASGSFWLIGPELGSKPLDYRTVRLAPDGQELWTQIYDGGRNDLATVLTVDEKNNVYVSGFSDGNHGLWGLPSTDTLTIKYDANGQERWRLRRKKELAAQSIISDDKEHIYTVSLSGMLLKLAQGKTAALCPWWQFWCHPH
jgi:hypothetical protein